MNGTQLMLALIVCCVGGYLFGRWMTNKWLDRREERKKRGL